MCKTIKNSFYDNLTFEKLLEAHDRAKQGKTNKYELLKFEMDLETNIMNLYTKLKNDQYQMGKYRQFIIHEPKERLIKALPYIDRVVHQWYVEEFIKPFIIPRFIEDTYACIDGRGTHKAIKKLQSYMRKMNRIFPNYYVLKCDIKKYFYSIDKQTLYQIMSKYICDKKLLQLTKTFIYDNDEKVGIPIGNYTSQFFANIYLNELDHYVKDILKIKCYIRYMDDFIILLSNKEEANNVLNKICDFVTENLHLTLNEKTRYYPHKLGVNFCGYIVYENHIKIRKRSVKKIRHKVKKWNLQYINNSFDPHHFLLCYNSFKGHAKHADTYYLLQDLESKFLFPYKS